MSKYEATMCHNAISHQYHINIFLIMLVMYLKKSIKLTYNFQINITNRYKLPNLNTFIYLTF